MDTHERYMQRCLDLAILGQGTVSPNPMVGAVAVVDDLIIGEGFTSPYGGTHAEVNAIDDVLKRYGEQEGIRLLKKATVYVSLEPCAHFGKTPPCADMLVAYQIKQIVVGCLDPFAKVNGLGIQKLKDAQIDVIVGVLEDACKDMNRRFFTRVTRSRPYVILKWAETADGFFAPEEARQQWITNQLSKQLVHKWRTEEDAILVGKNTVLIDNPMLNTRLWEGRSPKRVLIDKRLEVPASHAIFNADGVDVLVFNSLQVEWKGHVKKIELENFDLYLPQNILYQLYLMDIQSVIVEGGAQTIQMFMNAGLWDEARVFASQAYWKKGLKAPKIKVNPIWEGMVGNDMLRVYRKD